MSRILLVACCAGVLSAQTDPNRFVPANAQVVVRTVGCGGWKKAFAETRLARVFEGKTLASYAKKMSDDFEVMLERAAADGMPAEVWSDFLTKYHGEVVVSVCFDVDSLTPEEGRVPRFAVMIAAAPDGEFSLESLLQGFRKNDENYKGPWTEIQMGEHRFRGANTPYLVTQVEFVGDHLVMFVGNDVEALGPAMLAPTNRSERAPTGAPFDLHLDLTPIASLAVAFARSYFEGEEDVPEDVPVEGLVRSFGYACLQALDVTLAPVGDRIGCDIALTTTGQDLGLLGTVLVDQGRPSLLRLVPADTTFQVGALDLGAVVRVVEGLFTLAGEKAPMSWSDVQAAFAEATSVRLREDLLDHLGTEVLVLGDLLETCEVIVDAAQENARPDPNSVLAGYCLGVGLRDGKAFAQSVDKMLRKAGLHAARKTESYRDHEIHTLRLGVVSLEYAITDRVLLLVLGTKGSGSQSLRAVLDASRDGGEGGSLPEHVAKRIEGLPDGWSGIGTTPLVRLMQSLFEVAEQQRKKRGQDALVGMDIARGICDDLIALGLEDVVSVTYTSPRQLRTIYRW